MSFQKYFASHLRFGKGSQVYNHRFLNWTADMGIVWLNFFPLLFFLLLVYVFEVGITSLILIMCLIFSLLHLAELNCKIETRRLQFSVSSWNPTVSVSVVPSHCYMCFVMEPEEGFNNLAVPVVTVNQLFHFTCPWIFNQAIAHAVWKVDKHAYAYLKVDFPFTDKGAFVTLSQLGSSFVILL